jgi:hypothetical protein
VADRITHEEARQLVRAWIPAGEIETEATLIRYIDEQESLDSAHPGTEPPDNDRNVLARFGRDWAILCFRHGAWCLPTMGIASVPSAPDEWRELPEVPRA